MSGVFRSVLVPVEFETPEPDEIAPDRTVEVGDHDLVAIGECTKRALELTARLASGGEVFIVHAIREFASYATWTTPTRMRELEDDASRSARTVLAAIAAQYCRGVTLRYVIEPGNALDIILAVAAQRSPEAIVLAASARGRVHRALLGSTADKVIRQASCPVVVVPHGPGGGVGG
ncbi:MAG: universal stress protein [Deltaproteobacteria bacterium]|nr:universal stress protein [Nannocystaceae bacterium]